MPLGRTAHSLGRRRDLTPLATEARAETPAQLRVQVREAITADEPTLIEVPVGPMPDQRKVLGLR